MHIPEGLTEKQVLAVINTVVGYLAPSFSFGYHEVEDIEQEGRIHCIKALPKFDISKANNKDLEFALRNFLKRVVRNEYLNLLRKQLRRAEPPCHTCPFWDKESARAKLHDCRAFTDKDDCDKWTGWMKRNASKKNLMQPFDASDARSEASAASYVAVDEQVMSSEVLAALNTHFPASNRADYLRYLDGIRLPKDRRDRLIIQMKAVLVEHYSGEAIEWELQ